MRKKILLAVISLSTLLVGGRIVKAEPVYNGQTATTYFDQYYNDLKANGYQDLQDQGTALRMSQLRVTKLHRDIVGARYDHPTQFYFNYVGKEFMTSGTARPNAGWSRETYSIQQKLNYVKDGVNGQSQLLYPMIMSRISANDFSEYSEREFNIAPLVNMYFDSAQPYAQPQGYMYAETNSTGSTVVKQFVYGKDAQHFKVMWNPVKESLVLVALEDGKNPDKLMVVRADIDEIYRLVRVSGELRYFGEETKSFTLLNQMIYDNTETRHMSGYETYGKKKGVMMPMPATNSSIVIRTDLEDGPKNWAVKEFPYYISKYGTEYDNARGVEASEPKNFLSAFNPPTIDGAGFESDSKYDINGQKLTEERNLTISYDPGKPYDPLLSGTWSNNSIYLKSATKPLNKGESMKLNYGFEPTTRYKVPAIVPIPSSSKNEQDEYKTKVKWMNAVTGSKGGEIQFFVNDQPIEVTVKGQKYQKYPFLNDGDVEGEFDVTIDSKYFKPGVENNVKIEIKDDILIKDPGKVKAEEHSSSREFKIYNKRLIPIKYKLSNGKELEPLESMKTFVNLMDDGEATTVVVPETMTEKKNPLLVTDPSNDYSKLSGTNLNIKGNSSLKDGISVIYKVLEVDATVKMIDVNSGKQILKDLVNITPVPEHSMKELKINESIKSYIDAEKAKATDPLITKYDYYTLIEEPEYEIKVNGKPYTDAKVPEFDFEIIYKYQGEVGITKVPVLKFGDVNIGNNAQLKNLLTNDIDSSTVEMYNTVNKSDRRMTVELQGNIEKSKVNQTDPTQNFNGQLRYATSKENDQAISNAPIEILKTNAKDNYSKVNLKGSNESSPGVYLNQFPGNYGGSYEGTMVWKIVDDITK